MPTVKTYTYHKFGDHCVCFGIIKEWTKWYDRIECYSDATDENTFNTNKRLYSGIKEVVLFPEQYVEEIHKADHAIAHTCMWFNQVMPWLLDNSLPAPDWFDESWIFDRQWYFNAGFPLSLKWDNFYFDRDLKKEKEIFYDMLDLKDKEEFIFLHEDTSRNMSIDRKYINPNIKLVEFSKLQDINILDVLYIVEKSKEVHTFNTGTLTFIDLMNIQHNNLNYHKYVRPMPFDQPALRLNWNIIT
jgi:hypothetical protein